MALSNSLVCKISIITVTFNAADHLPGLVESLRQQTDQDFEWVVCDGASTDNTMKVVQSAHDLATVASSQPDFGIYDALNRAISLASGDYYLVLGADDRLAPTAVADYRQVALDTSADVISACVATDTGIDKPLRGQSWRRGHLAFVSQHAVGALIRKSLHSRFGLYSRRFPIAADQHFLKRVCMARHVTVVGAEFVAGHYSRDGVSGADIPGAMSEFFRVQLETERYPGFQVMLYGLRLIRHCKKIVAYGSARRASVK